MPNEKDVNLGVVPLPPPAGGYPEGYKLKPYERPDIKGQKPPDPSIAESNRKESERIERERNMGRGRRGSSDPFADLDREADKKSESVQGRREAAVMEYLTSVGTNPLEATEEQKRAAVAYAEKKVPRESPSPNTSPDPRTTAEPAPQPAPSPAPTSTAAPVPPPADPVSRPSTSGEPAPTSAGGSTPPPAASPPPAPAPAPSVEPPPRSSTAPGPGSGPPSAGGPPPAGAGGRPAPGGPTPSTTEKPPPSRDAGRTTKPFTGGGSSTPVRTIPSLTVSFTHVPTQRKVSFRAFLEGFNDTYNAEWSSDKVFGRMDPIPTYKGTDRKINISFTVPSESHEEAYFNHSKISTLLNFMYPKYQADGGLQVYNIAAPPLLMVKFNNLVRDAISKERGLLGYVSSLKYEPDMNSPIMTFNEQTINPDLLISNGYAKHIPGHTDKASILKELKSDGERIGFQSLKVNIDLSVLHTHRLGISNDSGAARGFYPYGISILKPEGN